jgi:hypothetical protein
MTGLAISIFALIALSYWHTKQIRKLEKEHNKMYKKTFELFEDIDRELNFIKLQMLKEKGKE